MRCTGSIESLIGQIAEFGTLESSTKHVKHVYLIQQNPVSKWSEKVDLTDVPSIDPSDRQAVPQNSTSLYFWSFHVNISNFCKICLLDEVESRNEVWPSVASNV